MIANYIMFRKDNLETNMSTLDAVTFPVDVRHLYMLALLIPMLDKFGTMYSMGKVTLKPKECMVEHVPDIGQTAQPTKTTPLDVAVFQNGGTFTQPIVEFHKCKTS